jgi:hypothetical protein
MVILCCEPPNHNGSAHKPLTEQFLKGLDSHRFTWQEDVEVTMLTDYGFLNSRYSEVLNQEPVDLLVPDVPEVLPGHDDGPFSWSFPLRISGRKRSH